MLTVGNGQSPLHGYDDLDKHANNNNNNNVINGTVNSMLYFILLATCT
jgi:hypothetical protein